jgi:hypothetical protein
VAISSTRNIVFGSQFPAGTVATQLHDSSFFVRSLTILAPSSNSDRVRIGSSTVIADSVQGLKPGTEIKLETDQAMNLTDIYIANVSGGDGVTFYGTR